jgi:NADH-quinone oxidoreductase subunit J
MDTLSLLFYTFAFVLVYAGFRVITAKSPVTAVLHLVLAFASASCVWMLLQAEFLAISLVLVYVGAVMVLFLFVVMMLDINTDSLRRGFWKHVPVAGLIGVLIVLQMSFVLSRGFDLPVAKTMPPEVAAVPNAKALGIELFSNYLFPVQVAAVILLVGIIAAIALTLRKRKDARFQKPAEQVRVKKADRLRVHKVAAVVEAPAVEADANNQAGGQA